MEIININSAKQESSPKGYRMVENKNNPNENVVEKDGKGMICPFKTIIPIPNINQLTGKPQGFFLQVHSCSDACMHFHKRESPIDAQVTITLTCGKGFEFEIK